MADNSTLNAQLLSAILAKQEEEGAEGHVASSFYNNAASDAEATEEEPEPMPSNIKALPLVDATAPVLDDELDADNLDFSLNPYKAYKEYKTKKKAKKAQKAQAATITSRGQLDTDTSALNGHGVDDDDDVYMASASTLLETAAPLDKRTPVERMLAGEKLPVPDKETEKSVASLGAGFFGGHHHHGHRRMPPSSHQRHHDEAEERHDKKRYPSRYRDMALGAAVASVPLGQSEADEEVKNRQIIASFRRRLEAETKAGEMKGNGVDADFLGDDVDVDDLSPAERFVREKNYGLRATETEEFLLNARDNLHNKQTSSNPVVSEGRVASLDASWLQKGRVFFKGKNVTFYAPAELPSSDTMSSVLNYFVAMSINDLEKGVETGRVTFEKSVASGTLWKFKGGQKPNVRVYDVDALDFYKNEFFVNKNQKFKPREVYADIVNPWTNKSMPEMLLRPNDTSRLALLNGDLWVSQGTNPRIFLRFDDTNADKKRAKLKFVILVNANNTSSSNVGTAAEILASYGRTLSPQEIALADALLAGKGLSTGAGLAEDESKPLCASSALTTAMVYMCTAYPNHDVFARAPVAANANSDKSVLSNYVDYVERFAAASQAEGKLAAQAAAQQRGILLTNYLKTEIAKKALDANHIIDSLAALDGAHAVVARSCGSSIREKPHAMWNAPAELRTRPTELYGKYFVGM